MGYDPEKHHRRSNRLAGYNYASVGAYFITVCTQNRQHILCKIENGLAEWSEAGVIVNICWNNLPSHYPHIQLDAFVVMPNHVHGIIILNDDTNNPTAKRHALPEIVRAFKTYSAQGINKQRQTQGLAVWQRNFYDHIIRDEKEFDAIRAYIELNPQQWAADRDNLLTGSNES